MIVMMIVIVMIMIHDTVDWQYDSSLGCIVLNWKNTTITKLYHYV